MRMRELVKRTGVSREMIHHFARKGLLPPIEKPSPNQAIYNHEHVERILLIKKLQEKHFLPLSLVKKILEGGDKVHPDEEMLTIKSDYFESTDHLLPREITGEEAFLEYTGMAPERLKDFEAFEVITFEWDNGVKAYSHDAVKIGKIIGDMRARGLSYENGFSRTALKELMDGMLPDISRIIDSVKQDLKKNNFPEDEKKKLAWTAVELIPLFIYHIAHTFLQEATKEIRKR